MDKTKNVDEEYNWKNQLRGSKTLRTSTKGSPTNRDNSRRLSQKKGSDFQRKESVKKEGRGRDSSRRGEDANRDLDTTPEKSKRGYLRNSNNRPS